MTLIGCGAIIDDVHRGNRRTKVRLLFCFSNILTGADRLTNTVGGYILASESATAISIMQTNLTAKERSVVWALLFLISCISFCSFAQFARAQGFNNLYAQGVVNVLDGAVAEVTTYEPLPVVLLGFQIMPKKDGTPYDVGECLYLDDQTYCPETLYGGNFTPLNLWDSDGAFAQAVNLNTSEQIRFSLFYIRSDVPFYSPLPTATSSQLFVNGFSYGETMISLLLLLILTALIFHTFWARIFGTKLSVPFYRTFLGNNSKEGKEIKNI